MDWESYKKLCDQPSVFTRWMVTQTLELVAQLPERKQLTAALATAPLEKPWDHIGDERTDMLTLGLSQAVVAAVFQAVISAENRDLTTRGTESRGLGGFSAAWREYLESF